MKKDFNTGDNILILERFSKKFIELNFNGHVNFEKFDIFYTTQHSNILDIEYIYILEIC